MELREAEEYDLEEHSGMLEFGTLQIRMATTIRRPVVSSIEIGSVENTKIEKESWINNYVVRLSNGN